MKSIDLVKREIIRITEAYLSTGVISKSTTDISDQLHLSRSLISKYLNHLYDEGTVIKVSTRPVIYLDRATLEMFANTRLSQSEFLSMNELQNELGISKGTRTYSNIVGAFGSFRDIVNGIESMRYNTDKRFMIIIIVGEYGSGRTLIISTMKQALEVEQRSAVFDCVNDRCDYMNVLFNKNSGSLRRPETQFLVLNDIDNLTESTQRDMMFKIKNRSIENEDQLHYLVLVAKDRNNIDDSVFKQANYVFNLPKYIDRPLKERQQLIYNRLKEHQEKRGKEILISMIAFHTLSNFDYGLNVSGLYSTIDELVISAERSSSDKKITIYRHDMPASMIQGMDYNKAQGTMLTLDNINDIVLDDRLIDLWAV